MTPARRAAHAVVRRVLEEGAYADRALHGEAQRPRRARPRASPSSSPSGRCSARGRSTGSSTRLAKGKTLEPPVRAALQLGLYQLLFLDGVAAHAAVERVRRARQAQPGPQARQRGPAPRDARGRRAARRRRPRRARRSATRTRAWLVRRWWDWLGAAGDPRAAGRRQRARRARAARQHARGRRPRRCPAAARATRSCSRAPSTSSRCRSTATGAFTRSRARRSWSRRWSTRSRASACSTSARRRAARRRTSRRSWAARARSSRSSSTRAGPRRCAGPCARLRAHNVDVRVAGRARARRGTRALRPRPARPAVLGPRDAAVAPRPALARHARRTSTGSRRCRTSCWTPRAGAAPGGRLVYSVCTLSPPEERLAGDARSARSRTATTPTASILPAMAEVELGLACPNCHEPWLRPTNLAGRYRCVYCLHRFELRSVCPDCGEHSTIVRMSSTATVDLQQLRRLACCSRYDAPRRAVDPVGRLRAPAPSRCRRSSTPAPRSSTSTSWTATSSRR